MSITVEQMQRKVGRGVLGEIPSILTDDWENPAHVAASWTDAAAQILHQMGAGFPARWAAEILDYGSTVTIYTIVKLDMDPDNFREIILADFVVRSFDQIAAIGKLHYIGDVMSRLARLSNTSVKAV